MVDDICIYISEFDNDDFAVEFVYDKCRYYIKTNTPYSEIVRVVRTIDKGVN